MISSIRIFLIAFSILFAFNDLKAQDLHYSQHIYNPLYYNPALTGYTQSKARLFATYADRYRQSFGKDGMRTVLGSVDFNIPISSPYSNQNNIGVGAYFYNHQVGNGITDNVGSILASYRLGLDRENKHTLAVGFNLLINNRSFNHSNLQFGNQFDGVFYNPSIPSGEVLDKESELNLNAGLGLLYAFAPNSFFKGYLGGSLFHLIPEQDSPYTFGQGLRYNIHAGLELGSQKLTVKPSLMFDKQNKATELYTGVLVNYDIIQTKSDVFSLFAGPYLRMYQSPVGGFSLYTVNVFAGIQYNNMQLFVAVDNTINSSKNTFGGFNGFEVGLSVDIGKESNRKQQIYCPVFR